VVASLVSHRVLLVAVGVVVAVAGIGMVVLWPGDVRLAEDDELVPPEEQLLDATLLEVNELPDRPDDFGFELVPGAVEVEVIAELDETGDIVGFDMIDDTGEMFEAGQQVRLTVVEQPDQPPTFAIVDFQRERPLLLLTAVFLIAVIALGRFQGVRALIGLALTFVVIITFIVPAILDGRSPIAVALFGALAIMVVTLYLAHGYSRKTTAAVVGTALALGLTVLLAVVFVEAASITGFTSEDARLANLTVGGLSLQGLLLAGIIIGGLGVLDDVTMSQASTVFELRRANPRASFAELVRGALNVGRDHIAATVNTLFLAYAGAALPLLILFSVGDESLGTIVSSEIVAVEIVRTLVGSIGLIAAVPLTTGLAAALVVGDGREVTAEEADGHGHGHGSGNGAGVESATVSDQPAAPPDAAPDKPADESSLKTPPPDDDDWEERLRAAYDLPDSDVDRGT
jgi:uncharacterized membrane protein